MRSNLCLMLEREGVRLSKDEAAKIIAYVALSMIDAGRVDDALEILRMAETRGVSTPQLRRLRETIEALRSVEAAATRLATTIERLLSVMESENRIDEGLLRQLKQAIGEAEKAVAKARSLGINVDDKPVRFARDIHRILSLVKEEYGAVRQAAQLFDDLKNYIETRMQAVKSVGEFAAALRGMKSLADRASRLAGVLEKGLRDLESYTPETPEARKLAEQIRGALSSLHSAVKALSVLGAESWIAGVYLGNVYRMIQNAYDNPGESPFGAAKQQFINAAASLLSQIKNIRLSLDQVKAEGPAAEAVNAIRQLGYSIANALARIARTLKYSTTFQDYRWNGLWEAAEAKAGYDLGSISKADVQRYEYRCDQSGCRLVEREGRLGRLMERLPEEVLAFFTTVEEFINEVEMQNRWAMRHAKNPILKAAGHIGYIGASIIGAVGSLLAPRMMAEGLKALGALLSKWADAIKAGSWSKIKSAAGETWRMFFGSKEAALATIGGLLLYWGVTKLLARGLPPGAKLPLGRQIAANLLQGDPIGAALVIVERAVPVARLTGVAKTLVSRSLKASKIADEAGILKRALSYAAKAATIRAVTQADKLHAIIKRALQRADTIKEAQSVLEKELREEGVRELARLAQEYRAAKSTLLSNLASLQVHAPTLSNRLRRLLQAARRGGAPEEELPAAVRQLVEEEVGEVWEALAAQRGFGEETLQALMKRVAAKNVALRESLEALQFIERAAAKLEKAGKRELAEAFRRLVRDFEKLLAEYERLKDVERALRVLEKVREIGVKKGLWREHVELGRKWKPGKGWLRKEKVSLDALLDQLRGDVEQALLRRKAAAEALAKTLKKLENRIGRIEEARALKLLIDELADELMKMGLDDLAKQVAEAGRDLAEGKAPVRSRIAFALERIAEGLARWAEKAKQEAAPELYARARAAVAREFPGLQANPLLLEAMARAYAAGAALAERVASVLRRLAGRLAKPAEPYMLEKTFIEKLSRVIRSEYGRASLENLALLKGFLKGLEAFKKEPYGAVLEALESSVETTLQAVERGLGSEIAEARLWEPARAALEELLAKTGELERLVLEAARKLDEIAARMEEKLKAVPGGGEALAVVKDILAAGRGEEPSEVIRAAREYLEAEGRRLPEDFWRAAEEYLETLKAADALETLAEAVKGGYATLEDVQRAINYLARLDLDLAWRADWAVVKGYLDELVKAMAEAAEAAKKKGLGEVSIRLEEAAGRLREIVEAEPKTGPFTALAETVEVPKTYEPLVSALEGMYEILRRGLGDDAVKNLRRLLDEFEEKLSKGVFDEKLLKSMRWELRKLKLKKIPAALKADLARLANWLRRLARRLREGKEAAEIEKAIQDLADEVKAVEEAVEAEKGWVALERVVEVVGLKHVRVPEEYAERVARIFQKRKRTFHVTTREGYKVKVTRRVGVKPDGTLTISYELEFPGGRRIRLDEIVRAGPDGKARVYRRLFYDPEAARALQALEEARSGLRGMDAEARVGASIEEVLTRSLAEIDPDYRILSKIAFVSVDGSLVPITRPLEDLLAKATSVILAGAEAARIGGEEELPRELYGWLQEALARLAAGDASLENLVALSLKPEATAALAGVYAALQAPGTLPQELRSGLERLGVEPAGVAPGTALPGGEIILRWPEKERLDPSKIYFVLPEDYEDYARALANPERIVEIVLPGIGSVFLPAFTIGPAIAVMIPPFSIEIPDTILTQLQEDIVITMDDLQQAQLQAEKPETKPVPRIPPPTTTEKPSLPPPPVIPPVPVLPWMGGAGAASAGRERERLNIV